MSADLPTPHISPDEFRSMFAGLPQPKPTMRDVALSLGSMLQKLRVGSVRTLRQLELESGVPNSVISAIETGKRRCGAAAAKKLANAFFGIYECPERSEFLYAAAATIKARGAVEDSQLYPPAVLDAVAAKLRRMGVRDRDILGAYVEDPSKNRDSRDLLIVLHGGRRLSVAVTITDTPSPRQDQK